MEDFFAAGGMSAVLRELAPLLDLDCLTVTGETLGERIAAEQGSWVDRAVIRAASDPVEPVGGLVALFGSLAPRGAILKRSAADARLFEKEGRAVVFSSLADLAARIDRDDLDVTPDDVLVLKNAGPVSGTGMPEAGYLPIPGQARARRGQGHDPHLRRADERHRVRHRGAARDARGGAGRAAGAGRKRRPHPAVRRQRGASTCWSTTPNSRAGAQRTRRRRRRPRAATRGCTPRTCCRPTRAATSISCAAARRRPG